MPAPPSSPSLLAKMYLIKKPSDPAFSTAQILLYPCRGNILSALLVLCTDIIPADITYYTFYNSRIQLILSKCDSKRNVSLFAIFLTFNNACSLCPLCTRH
jgi:hypothetical protein